jgi:hypothetical protein
MINIFYKRFFYNECKQWYWVFRIDILNKKLKIYFWKQENPTWDINILYKKLRDSLEIN